MKKTKYNFWYALLYELLNDLSEHFKNLKQNKVITLILNHCKHDWILWKVESTLKEIDTQVEQIKQEWQAEDPVKYSIIEHEPDGSTAQQLLGGAMEIRSNFKRE
jgi:hypothetical protein